MRVTDEMVERAFENLAQGPMGDRADVRAWLEATLAHVHEPVEVMRELERRADAAERRLDTIRIYVGDREVVLGAGLRALLDCPE